MHKKDSNGYGKKLTYLWMEVWHSKENATIKKSET